MQCSPSRTLDPRRTTVWTAFHRCSSVLLCGLLTFSMLGCPSDDAARKTGGPASKPVNATAPPLAPSQQATSANPLGNQQGAKPGSPATAPPDAAGTQHAAAVAALIARAESSYRSGVSNYNGNRLDAARIDFDYAVDTMLSSGMDLKNDPQLSDEFEQMLSSINSLELVALKQGNGFSPPLEEVPLIAADEVTFAPDPALLGKVTAELRTTQSDFPLVINDYVAGWINAFTTRPALHAYLKRSLERSGKYKDMISRVLRENGVPQDLIYQAVRESGFQPRAFNRGSGAGGMWQFMAANDYLHRNGYFDERFDPEKSTVAYAKFMKALHAQFGDWYLAMAAYDWGPARVQNAVARTGYADYWDLYRHSDLPAETKAYIPGVIATIIMAKNPQQYGFADLTPDPPVLSDTVTTNYSIDLRLVADLANSNVADIVALNPALLRLATPPDTAYDLHLPVGTRAAFLDRIGDIPEEHRADWRFHVVKSSETLDSVAAQFHTGAVQIAAYNEVTASQPIEEGDELVIPIETRARSSAPERYKTRRGDTVVSVADRFGVSVQQLRAWNHLSSARLLAGRTLYVAEPLRLAPGAVSARGRRGRSVARGRSASGRRSVAGERASRGSRVSLGSRASRGPRSRAVPSRHAARSNSHASRPKTRTLAAGKRRGVRR